WVSWVRCARWLISMWVMTRGRRTLRQRWVAPRLLSLGLVIRPFLLHEVSAAGWRLLAGDRPRVLPGRDVCYRPRRWRPWIGCWRPGRGVGRRVRRREKGLVKVDTMGDI